MIILMKKYFERKFLLDALAFKFNYMLITFWRAKRAIRNFGFDV